MPQISKRGKFIFGWSLVSESRQIIIPNQAYDEYLLKDSDKVILISGSKRTGGFCVSSKIMIEKSSINGLFEAFPLLHEYKTNEGEFVKYKGRLYCWVNQIDGILMLSNETLNALNLKIGDKLLSIRGSDIAFVMGAKGPLIERANKTDKHIDIY
jgi:bifunctional DNA-binding transcriptional regulator/antitoxin component of YhaV-PrlF toxin-antitoxin module